VPRKHQAFFKVLLMQQDLEIIVALLRSKFGSKNLPVQEYTMGGVYITDEDVSHFDTMTFDQVRQLLLKTPFAQLAEQNLEDVCKNHDIQTMVYDIYYSKMLEASRSDPYLEQYAKLLVDIYNIRKAFSFRKKKITHKGSLSTQVTSVLERATSLDEVKRSLEGTTFFLTGSDIRTCFTELLRHKKQFGKNLAKKESISISQFLAYFIQKHTELRNIRIILKLTKAGFAPQKIAEVLL
jgi:vacuolar-type H+-ATPase subunit C/Vma6